MERVRICDYLVVAQLFLQDNFLLKRPLTFDDVKPRLLGHWGTCHGINFAYTNLREHFGDDFTFILGPGHGFPALQANLFYDGVLGEVDPRLKVPEGFRGSEDFEAAVATLCREFSWPGGFPSHASPMTPGVICEGGELGYALGTGYGVAAGHPEKTVAVLIGDGELETATALASMNLVKIFGESGDFEENGDSERVNGKMIPILHLNGYKITGPTIYGRKSERELAELIRGFGYEPITVIEDLSDDSGFSGGAAGFSEMSFAEALELVAPHLPTTERVRNPFIIMKTEKGAGGPRFLEGRKVAGNYLAHQIPLKNAKTDEKQLKMLEEWLRSYRVFDAAEKVSEESTARSPEEVASEIFVDMRREIL